MQAAVIVFPGSNCDRDVAVALEAALDNKPHMVWHRDTELPQVDLVVVPGGFSYGDYLRGGAMAAHSPILRAVKEAAARGVAVLGICNGFQILTEAGLLPGVLMRNAGLRFVCKPQSLRVERNDTPFTRGYGQGQVVCYPIAHNEGNYYADDETLARLEDDGRIVFRYCDAAGATDAAANPNGSRNNIAGLTDKSGRILGLMPHPERVWEADLCAPGTGPDGWALFASLV